MKSVKPGRGPSFMGGISSLFGVVFGVIWTIGAASIGAPAFFWLFGVVFVCMGIGNAIYQFKNATGEQHYSEYDIVDSGEEPDPWNEHFGGDRAPDADIPNSGSFAYCPYCGARLGQDFAFCGKCGREVPREE